MAVVVVVRLASKINVEFDGNPAEEERAAWVERANA